MAKPDVFVVDSRAFCLRSPRALRRQQLEAWKAIEGRQLALSVLKTDYRSRAERLNPQRYQEASLLKGVRGGLVATNSPLLANANTLLAYLANDVRRRSRGKFAVAEACMTA